MLPNLATGRVRAAVKVISSDDLIENGGSFRIQGRVAFRVNNLTGQTNLPASHQAMAVYPISQADIDSGRFALAGGGPAVRVVDIDTEGISRVVMSGGAVPVYVVEGDALGVSVPDVPTNLVAVQNGATQIDLTWNVANGADGYYIERSDGDNSSFVQIDSSVSNSHSDTGLSSAIYYYRVRAYNAVGNSAYSNETSVVVALFRDSFSVNQAAPITSPRTPDVGANATVLDTGSFMPVSAGKLHIAGVQTAFANPLYTSGAITNQTGACHIAEDINLAASQFTNSNAAFICGSQVRFSENAPGTISFLFAGAGPNNLSIPSIQDATLFFVRSYGGRTLPIYTNGSLVKILFVPYGTHATTLQFVAGNTIGGVGGDISLSEIRSVYLPAPYSTEYGIVTNRVTPTANGSATTSEADAIIEHTITAATGVTQELMVRRIDDDNCIIIRMDQAGSTIKVIKKEAGVETELASAAQTWTNATGYVVVVILDGTSIKTYVSPTSFLLFAVKNSTTNSYNQTEIGIKVSHAGTNLIALPLYLSGAALGILDF